MAAPLLAEFLGGTPFLGFIAAVAFATILAVVAGLTLSGAAALSHDLWASVVRRGRPAPAEELRVARLATRRARRDGRGARHRLQGPERGLHGVARVRHRGERRTSRRLILCIFWRRCTTAGAVASMVTGTLLTLLLIALSPTVQVDLLGTAGRRGSRSRIRRS